MTGFNGKFVSLMVLVWSTCLLTRVHGQVEGDVQLTGGINDRVGRLEYNSDGTSGGFISVCGDNFGYDEATVVCNQLGLSILHATPVYDGPWSDGTGQIQQVYGCDGTEIHVDSCTSVFGQSEQYTSQPSVNGGCYHSEDVGVHCIPECHDFMGVADNSIPDENLKASSVKDNRDATYGRLDQTMEVGGWLALAAEVSPWIQADLGYQTKVSGIITQGCGDTNYMCYTTSVKASYFLHDDTGEELFVEDPDTGDQLIFDANTDSISYAIIQFPELVFARIVRITCVTKAGGDWNLRFEVLGCNLITPTENDPLPELRLVGGTSSYSGRVEINIFSEWGTINDSNFDDDDAKVMCRQLGLPHKHAREHNVFPDGSGPVVYTDLQCTGNEERIDFCQHTEYPDLSDHSGDVGIICTNHAAFETDYIRTYDGVLDYITSISGRIFRIQEGAIVKFICASNKAGGLNTLKNDHFTMQWQLGEQDVLSDNIDGVKLDQDIQMYQSNGLGFNGRKGKRLSSMIYTARMEDNLKEISCEFYDEDDYDSVVVAGAKLYDDIKLLVLPGPEPQHFKTTVTNRVWLGGFSGRIHIPITRFYNSWKIVLEFPRKVFRLYGGNFNIAPEPCLHAGSCTKSKYTWIIYNTYENRVLSPLKDLDLTFFADVSKKLNKGRGRGLVADIKFYGFNKVFVSDYAPEGLL